MLYPDLNEFRESAAQSRAALNRQRRALTRSFNSGLVTAARVVGLDRRNLSYTALVGALDLAAEACADPKGIARLEGRGAKLLADLATGSKPTVAEDLVVILPAPAGEELEAAFEARGLTCNTDRRRKGPTRHLWEGKAIAAEIAGLVEPVGGIVNVVRTPQASPEPADLSLKSAISTSDNGKDQNGMKSDAIPSGRVRTGARTKHGVETDESNVAATTMRMAATTPMPKTETMGEAIPFSSLSVPEPAQVKSTEPSLAATASAKTAAAMRVADSSASAGAPTSADSALPSRPQLVVRVGTPTKVLPPTSVPEVGAVDQPLVATPPKEMDGVAMQPTENINV